MKLRRTIYIGLGGTGIEVIRQLKAMFTKNGREELPSMIKFLAVDTNRNDLDRLREFEPNEKFSLKADTDDAYDIYSYNPKHFEWIPEDNVQYLRAINHNGANQVRSNGRFLFETTEVRTANPGQLTARINSIVDRITNVRNENTNYADAQNGDIDICLVFSIAGGTGSGSFLPMAYLLKGINPNFNIVGYGFADSFFSNIGVRRNIKVNAYAALLELDFCMQAERREYKIVKFPSRSQFIDRAPFDYFMYIDSNAYTVNSGLHQVTRNINEAYDTVVNALYLSATTVGAENQGVLNNLRGMMQGAASTINVRNNGTKKAWVSSVGTAEFKCQVDADTDKLALDVAMQELNLLKKGSNYFDDAKWASTLYNDKLHINEGGNAAEGDHDELINAILNPTEMAALNPNAVIVNASGNCNTTQLDTIKAQRLTSMMNNANAKAESCTNVIRSYILESLFPSSGMGDTCGVDNIKAALSVFEQKIGDFKAQMLSEESDLKAEIDKLENEISQLKKALKSIGNLAINGGARKHQLCQDIALHASQIAVKELELKRREFACQIYENILALSGRYYTFLSTIIVRIDEALTRIGTKRADSAQASTASTTSNSISISLDGYAAKLCGTVNTTLYKIKDWREFYSTVLNNKSVEELSEITIWDDLFTNHVKLHLPKATAPIIMRALAARLDKEDLARRQDKTWDSSMSFINRLVDMARPLMDVHNYGAVSEVKSEHIKFVSFPEFDQTGNEEIEKENSALRKRIQDAFKQVMGENVKFITHNDDGNSIIVFQQLGVVSPYFLKGVASKGANAQSCESHFRNLQAGYSPFSDNEFEKVVKEKGHDLYQQISNHYTNEDMARWIKAIILGIVERGGRLNSYRIETESGEMDQDDYRFWKDFGPDRHEAFVAFSSCSAAFQREIDDRINEELQDGEKARFFSELLNSGRNIALKYSTCNLVDRANNELSNPKARKQEADEIAVLRNMQ